MRADQRAKVIFGLCLLTLCLTWVLATMRPAQADAADDLVRRVEDLSRKLEQGVRHLDKIGDELERIRTLYERSERANTAVSTVDAP